ncbi:POTRA domain-containing protein [Terracidiphilus sp.]|uniref:BamA/OMP85 family outer membrane protein n=1 Tax=Terracidiphilus sp. TaxID=1964191 RepID=UPI003C1F317C
MRRISIEGVSEERLSSLHLQLAQTVGEPLAADKVSASLRLLYATGLFDSIEAAAAREGDGVALIFRGTARAFIGHLTVEGAKGATINTQLERTSRLNAGTRYSEALMNQAIEQMRQILVSNGFYESSIKYALTPNAAEQLVDIAVTVTPGPQARIGTVTVTGDTSLSLDEFRKYARLVPGRAIDHDTVNRALEGVLKHYQKQRRLEADVKLESQEYVAHRINYRFTATRGPVVNVHVEGVKLNDSHIKRLVPIYEEGSVDEDLLNEGGRRIRNYYQSQGYFDVKVDHSQQTPAQDLVLIDYNVQLGARRKVESVNVDGNHYFDAATLKQLLNVHAANALDRQGAYSQSLVSADIAALSDTYKNNGFSKVSITPETGPQASTGASDPAAQTGRPASKILAPLTVVYHITEGPQQHVGTVTLTGNDHVSSPKLIPQMNTVEGQLLSPRSLAGDRDAMLNEYLLQGFNEAHIDVEEVTDTADADKINVVFHIVEGSQTFVRKVLLTGLHYTRPSTVTKGITIKAGDPLNQQALQETQKNLYNYALFNEVDTAIQNPNGGETEKTVLLQTVEARRWTLTYGAGFEAQTGTPQNNCAGLIAAGVECSANGHTGVSLRGLASITRNNLFGRDQSASISGNYGTLEQRVDLIYQYPHPLGAKNFGLTFSGGYANSQAVTTYVASRLDAGIRITQKFTGSGHGLLSRANTFIYEFDFRRVKVDENSIQVYPLAVAELSSAVRVGGPGFTWIRDTRDNPTDATRGSYTTFQEFISVAQFGAQAQFNRIDLSNSSYYTFDKGKFVFARNTRYGQERAFGNASGELLPLPERLYAGGATSLRGFSSNAAGPRDPQTGFPIGGAGALINSFELRLPPPTLPYFGNTLSFVLFHDMGNVFTNAGDMWASAIRVRQPDRDTCKTLTPPNPAIPPNPPLMPLPPGPNTSTGKQGYCSFNYFSHTPGLGLRYHTPVGPIRFDFSYNLNPPIYPIDVNYSQTNPYENQHVGEAGHFNFFFSLGQTF